MAGSSIHDSASFTTPVVSLLTKTIVTSPVTKWILPARIRHRSLNDIVFVGEDFIKVKQVRSGGHLQDIISKHDFGSRICAADVFTIDDPHTPSEEDLFSHDSDFDDLPTDTIPAQLLVLVLEISKIMFLYIAKHDDGTSDFKCQSIPLPRWPDALHQVGEHIAIDPLSRAILVAARGGELVVYSAKRKEDTQEQLRLQNEDWCPITQERIIKAPHTIQHVAFLHPRTGETDHVILLLVLVDDSTRRTKLQWYDWHFSGGVGEMQGHRPVPIETPRCASSLLIPLRNANFILAHGEALSFYKDLLAGTVSTVIMESVGNDQPPVLPGNSPRRPTWANWCRPMQGPQAPPDQERLYLVREDGKVFWLMVTQHGSTSSGSAGDLQCHVGTAFASFGDDRGPDLLAVAADMSTGRVVSIGDWPAFPGSQSNSRTRQETMDMKLVEHLPNWASITDMVVAKVQNSHARSSKPRDSIFVCSGRQPYGSINELRHGLEARIFSYFDLDNLSSMLDVWTLPNPEDGALLLFLATPGSTVLYALSAAGDGTPELEIVSSVFDNDHRTLAAAMLESRQIVQVTTKRIIAAFNLDPSFEDKAERTLTDDEDDAIIICASVEPKVNTIVWCERQGSTYSVNAYLCSRDNYEDNSTLEPVSSQSLMAHALCMATTVLKDRVLIFVATDTGHADVFVSKDAVINRVGSIVLAENDSVLADQMVVLRHSQLDNLLVAFSSRDGDLFSIVVDVASSVSTGERSRMQFGQSTTKLNRHSSEMDRAYAMCGADTCLITYGSPGSMLRIDSIWATDSNRPGLPQNHIFGCTRIPPSDELASGSLQEYGGHFVMLSNNEMWFCILGQTPGTRPRQIRVKGTPQRLIYSYPRTDKSLVCAMEVVELTGSSGHRRIVPHIQLVPLTGTTSESNDGEVEDESYDRTYVMEPGEKVYSLLHWQYSPKDKDKSWHFIVVGSSYLKTRGSETLVKGRATFLQKRANGTINRQFTLSFDEPVFALAMYDDSTLAICYGRHIVLHRFSVDTSKLQPICAPYMLSSIGTYVSCESSIIHVTTVGDSLIALKLEHSQPNGAIEPSRLVPVSTGPRAERGVSHAIVSLRHDNDEDDDNDEGVDDDVQVLDSGVALLSTRERSITGLSRPRTSTARNTYSREAKIILDAWLPQSIIRLRHADVRPAWKPAAVEGVLNNRLIGCCTDGSLVGLSVINEGLWRRLFWLQRLCEWSPTITSPSYGSSAYLVDNDDHVGTDRAFPIGLSKTVRHDIMLSAPESDAYRGNDMHINGDVLVRILERGRAVTLRTMIETASRRSDRVGEWLTQHLDEEMEMIDDCISDLSILLDSWL